MQGKVGAVLAPLGFGLLAIALLGAGGANAVTDATPPSLTLPAAATTNATSSRGAVVSFTAVATDDVQPTSLSCAPASGAQFAVGTTTVTCTAMDATSHSTSASFAIAVLGASDQLALLRAAVIGLRLAPDVQQGLLDKLDAAKASIDGAQPNIACNQLNAFEKQVKAQTGKAIRDGSDLLNRQHEVEAALDCVPSTAPPVLLGPRSDVTTTTAPGQPTATVRFTGASSSVSCSPASPATLGVGADTVRCTATDANGTTRISFVVTVVDREPPVITMPADMTVTAPAGYSDAPVDFTVGATDNVPGVSTVCTPPSGSRFAYGTTTVSCTATDTSGNTARGTFHVTVNFAISGRITDRDTGLPLAGVRAAAFDTVTGNRVNFTASGSDGRYSVVVPPGTYTVLFNGNEAVSYLPQRWNSKRVDRPGDPVTLGGSVGGVDALLVPGYFVHGQVTDALTHQLIGPPGVVVDAVDPALPCCRTISESATAPDGTYRLVVPKGSPVKLQFRADPSLRYMERWWNGRRNFNEGDALTVNAETFGIDVALIPAVLISGQVTDDRDGSGIGSVAVVITDSTTRCCPFGGITVTSTVSNGTYSLLVPKGVPVKIQFVPFGSADPHFMGEWFNDQPSWDAATIETFTADTSGINAGLSYGFFISGHVTRLDNTPIEGLFVNANDGLAGCCHFITGSRTNASGDYRILVRPGTYKVLFFSRAPFLAADGLTYVDQWWNRAQSFDQGSQIVLSTADAGGINAVMTRAVIVSGHVSDASGLVPVAGFQVNALDASGPCCQFVGGAQTDAQGNYTIALAPGQTVKIDFGVFSGPPPGTRYLPQWWNNKTSFEAADPILAAADVPNINARLANGFLITGHVSERGSGAALSGVHVQVIDPAVPCCPFREIAHTQTSATGDYALALAPGSYKVQFFEFPLPAHPHISQWWQGKPDDQHADLLVVAGDRPNIDAGLALAVSISGHVSDATGNIPVPGFQVNALDATVGCCQFVGGAQTDAQGNYSIAVAIGSSVKVDFGIFGGPPPGTRYLGEWWNDRLSFETADTVTANANVANIDARLANGFLVTGHVSERGSGAALSGMHVQVIDPSVLCCPFREIAHTQTGASGDYAVVVAAGSYKVQFFEYPLPAVRPHISQWWQNKPFDQGADLLVVAGDRTGIDATLPVGVFISGSVTAAGGTVPVVGLNVSAQDASQPCCRFVGGAQTDTSGHYRFPVPAGSSLKVEFGVFSGPPPGTRYLGQWWNNKPNFETANTIGPLTDVSGINADLASGFVLSGHVSDATGTIALAGIGVSANDATMPCCQFIVGTQTDASGNYRLIVPAGRLIRVFFSTNPAGGVRYLPQWWNGKPFFDQADDIAMTQDRPGIDARLASGVLIHGRVTDATGTFPVAGLNVSAQDATQFCCQFVGGSRTDLDGQYTMIVPSGHDVKIEFGVFSGPPPGTRYLGQWWNNAATFDTATPVGTVTDQNGIDARLEQGFVISGMVRAPGGVGVPNVFVGASIGGTADCCIGVGGTNTDVTGHYRLILRAGVYRINVSAPPDRRLVSQWWAGVPGGTAYFQRATDISIGPLDATDRDFDIVFGTLIRGHVSDASNGAALGGIGVTANEATIPCCEGLAFTGTDPQGNYFLVVPSGRQVRVFFSVGPGSPYTAQWWNNKPDFGTADLIDTSRDQPAIDARLASGFLISGHVIELGGGPLGGVDVSVIDPVFGCCPFREIGHARTDALGNYSVRVPAGTYKIEFSPFPPTARPHMYVWWPDKTNEQDATPIVVSGDRPGIDAALPRAVFIRGNVSDAATAAPIPGTFVAAWDATVPCCRNFTGDITDPFGNYAVIAPLGSQVKVGFGPPAGSRYLQQFWNGQPSFEMGTTINATADQDNIDAHLQQGFVISGTVRLAGGQAAGIQVNASHGGSATCCDNVGHTATDPAGHYQLTLPAGMYRINVPAAPDSRVVMQWWNGTTGGTAYFERAADITVGPGDAPGKDFTLGAASLIEGHVTDAAGVAIGGVGVTARDATLPCCEIVAGGETDQSGNYVLVVPFGSHVRVAFGGGADQTHLGQWWNNKPSFDVADIIDASSDHTGIDAHLVSGFRIQGRVSDRLTGASIANVNVEIFDPTFPCCPNRDVGGGITDASGDYLAIVPAGNYRVAFHPPPGAHYMPELWNGKTNQESADPLIVIGDMNGIDAHLAPAVFIDGRVTDEVTGAPIQGIVAQAMLLTPFCCTGIAGANTDVDGRYRLIVPAGTYKLFFGQGIAARAYVAEWWDNKASFPDADQRLVNTDTVVDVQLAPGLFVRGHVTDTSGNPVRGAGVNAYDASVPCCRFVGGSGTDQNGDYALTLPAGSYKIQFFPPPGTPFFSQFWNGRPPQFELADTLPVSGDVSGINAQLMGGFSIRGNVSDRASHTAIANIDVQAYDALVPCCRFLGGTRTNQFGDYTLPLPSAATVKLTFQAIDLTAPAYVQRWWSDKADFGPADQIVVNGNVTNINEVMDAGYKITGRVTDSANPTIGVLDVFVAAQPNVGCCFYGTKTMADGRYIVVVSAATYRISFFPPPGTDFLEQWWNNRPGFATADLVPVPSTTVDLSAINAALVHGIPVAGSVTDSSTGAAVAGVGVVADRDDPPASCCLSYQARTGADGRYTMYVSAGTYRVNFQPSNTTDYVIEYWDQKPNRDSADLLTVTGPTSNIDARLDRGFRISGRVTDAATGDPLSFSVVTINPLGCCQAFTVVGTAPDGTYSVLIRAGSYKIGFNPPFGTDFVPQYWDGKPDLASADTLAVNGVQPNISAALAHRSAGSGPPSDGTAPAGSGP